MSYKILIVEDDAALQKVLRERLETEGWEVLTADNGSAGLSTALEKHPDLVLSDIVMPVMDGITMLQNLRKDAWGEGVSVILLTNLDDAQKASDALENNAFDFLVKSQWGIEDVVNRIKHYFYLKTK